MAETINIVTYYPAPFGMYRQMGVTERLTFDKEAGLLIAKGEEATKTDTSVEMNNIGSYNNEPSKGIIKIKITDRKVSKEK